MTTELTVLAWGCLLALVHIFAAGQARTRQYGAKWNMGARDEAVPEPSPLVGRLSRAQANFFETFPVVVAVIAILAISGRANGTSALGAWIWLVGRVVYLPLYAFGVPVVRSLVFTVSFVGLAMMLWVAFMG